jgi:hypothetical protein
MPITKPSVDADNYLSEDSENIQPKVGTTVQEGWDGFDSLVAPTEFPTDFKFSEESVLIKFLQDHPFATYESHWIDGAKGKKSFVCLGDKCPLCDSLGDLPRGKFAFNILVLTGETQGVQILTAPPTLARLIKKNHDDDRKGPIDKDFWEVSRQGTAALTQYTMIPVKERDLVEEWKLDINEVNGLVAAAVPYTASAIRETPRSEMLEVARSIA